MTEIWNLSTLCRCCHADGHFKSLSLSYQGKNAVEIYAAMLRDTLGISISTPPLEVSYTICENCIHKLRDASNFKNQVLMCEQKFEVYCRNEQFLTTPEVIKLEVQPDIDDYNNDITSDKDDDDLLSDRKFTPEIKEDHDSQTEETTSLDVKKEYKIEVDIKHPIKEVKKEEPQSIKKTTDDVKKTVKTIRKRIRTKNVKKEPIQKRVDMSLIIEVDTKNGLKYSCKNCGERYQTKEQIYRHIYKLHSFPFKCGHCSIELPTYVGYKKHLKLHNIDKFQCPKCPKKFNYKYGLREHLNTHTKEKIYKCDLCQKDFKYRTTLIKHLKVHAGTNKQLLCDLCGNSFNDRTNLQIHVRVVHEKLKPYDCSFCPLKFSTKTHLTRHLRLHEGGNKYKCDVCDHKLSCQKTMRIHRLKHDNKFMCKHCLAIFDDLKLRRDHMRMMHHRTYPCELCEKFFTSKHSLNRHVDEHNGIKKFPCELCGFKFSQKTMLNRHIFRKHNPDTNFEANKTKCEICKHSFKNIIAHMDVHKNRKSACEFCGKTYPGNSALNRHKAQKHFGVTHDCEVCGKKYQQRSKLNTHKLKVHKIKIEKVSLDGS